MQQGLADIPNRRTITKVIEDNGTYIIKEMPKLKFQIQTDLKHFCWKKEKLRVTLEGKHIVRQDFDQTGFKVTYHSSKKFNVRLTY